MSYFNIKDKKAIVTGAGRGIGKTFARALLEEGARVALIDVAPGVAGTAAEMAAETGAGAYGVTANLLDREDRRRAFDECVALLGGVDILVNNAGMQIKGDFLTYPDNDWDMIIELNLSCAFSMMKCAGKVMADQKSGKIVNITSMNAFFGGTNCPAYAASKAGIAQLTKSGANELGPYGVNVNAIAPGFIETDLTKHIAENKETFAAKTARIPMGRWGKTNDLCGPLIFLCSPASDYVCGAVLPVDGGYLCK